jgi:hypothetical protein
MGEMYWKVPEIVGEVFVPWQHVFAVVQGSHESVGIVSHAFELLGCFGEDASCKFVQFLELLFGRAGKTKGEDVSDEDDSFQLIPTPIFFKIDFILPAYGLQLVLDIDFP